MGILAALAPILGDVAKTAVGRILPDSGKAAEVEKEIQLALLHHEVELTHAATQAVVAEAKGESWLQRCWRPITMLTFLGCVVSFWFGLTPEHLGEAHIDKILSIIQLGLGGYVMGRSGEKIIATWKEK